MIKRQTIFNNVDEAYRYFANELIYNPDYAVAGTNELLNVGFTVLNAEDAIPYTREMSMTYALAELIWYFAGSPSKDFIGKFASMWDRITDDGFTSNSAYGYILKYKHGFDQIEKVIEMLKLNKHNRRAVMNINVPNHNMIETKDEPCTIALQVNVRDDRVHMTAIMRSNDIWFGFPYDVVFFNAVQKYIAYRLGLGLGTYSHFATSLHIYNKDIKQVTEQLKQDVINTHRFDINIMKIVKDATELYKTVERMDNPKDALTDFMIDNGYVEVWNIINKKDATLWK